MPRGPEDAPRQLLLRILTEAGDAATADHLEARLLARLAPFHPQPRAAPEAYWKTPGWYEHFYGLSPADAPTFAAVLALAETGWYLGPGADEALNPADPADPPDGERDGVWNPVPGQIFLLPPVRWVQVLLIQASDARSF